jgi:hypothetical protein
VLDKLHDAHGARCCGSGPTRPTPTEAGTSPGRPRHPDRQDDAGVAGAGGRAGRCTTSVQVVPKEQCLVNEAQTTALARRAGPLRPRRLRRRHRGRGTGGRPEPPRHTGHAGQRGAGGERPRLRRGLRDPQLDFAEVHDWNADDEAMPAAPTATPVANSPQCLGADAKLGCSFAQLSAINKPPAGRRGGHRRPHRGRPADPRHAARRQDARGVRGGSERLPALARHQGSARPVRSSSYG